VKKSPAPHQGPKKRGARRIQVCPSSEEQRARWQAAAKRARLSLSAWLTWLADAVADVAR
jgi:hypothetical protein